MSEPARHEPFESAVAAYVLGALPQSEEREFEAHVAGCDACQAEVATLRAAADALPASAAPVEPPPELRSRIMGIVRSEAELLRAAGPAADRPPQPVPDRRRWWQGFGLRPAVALAATAAALVIGGVAGFALNGGGDGVRNRVATVTAQGASASLRIESGGAGTLTVRDLPRPPRGAVYQVWLQRGTGAPVPTDALFEPRADGSASVAVPGDLQRADRVLVSTEPAGGSSAPTTKPLIVVAL